MPAMTGRMTAIPHLALGYLILEWVIRLLMIVVIPLRRPPEAARSWLLLVLFLPVPAIVFYRLIGRPDFPAWRRARFAQTAAMRAQVAAALGHPGADAPAQDGGPGALSTLARSLGGFPACGGNAIAFHTDYEETIAALIAAIDGASHEVHLITYIFADDRTGQAVAAALGRARQRGVAVRVLVDALGSRGWTGRSLPMLHRLDIDARLVLPVRFAPLRRARSDLRNHRKLCLIDGGIAFIGSQNIVARDFRPGIVNDELVARVEGPVVAALAAIFASDWYLETRILLPAPAIPAARGAGVLQAMPSGPDFDVPGFGRLLVEMVHLAARRVCLVSPYLIPDEALLMAIRNAAARGVEVDLVVSAVADQRLVSLAQRSYYQELLEAGANLYQYRDRLLHAKTFSIDDTVGVIGSSNADVRSFMLNAEISLILRDRDDCARLLRIQHAYIAGSTQLTREAWSTRAKGTRVLENLARLVSPLL